MSEEQTQNTNPQDSEDIAESTEQVESEPQKSAKKGKGDKKSAKDAQKEQSRLKKEWEDSIVASKRSREKRLVANSNARCLSCWCFRLS